MHKSHCSSATGDWSIEGAGLLLPGEPWLPCDRTGRATSPGDKHSDPFCELGWGLPGTSWLLVTAGFSHRPHGMPRKPRQAVQSTLCRGAQQGQGVRVRQSSAPRPEPHGPQPPIIMFTSRTSETLLLFQISSKDLVYIWN